MIMDNKLGKVISNLRKEMGITQKDLADALNISDKAISRWERGTSRPTLEMMFQISKFFNISYNDLITARISDKKEDDKIVEDIIKEFSDMGKKNVKRIKFILLFSVAIILILTIAIIFTNTYNRFKVYKVHSENNTIDKIYGTYIETNIRDTLFLGDIKIKDVEISKTDSYILGLNPPVRNSGDVFNSSPITIIGPKGEVNLEVTDVGTMTIHIGANMDQNMIISVPEISTKSLYIDDLDVTKMGGANDAMSALDDAIVPEATPPESNATPVNISLPTNAKIIDNKYPGIKNHNIDIPVIILIIARPIAIPTPIDKLLFIAFSGIAPSVISLTCLFNTATAGSAITIKYPIIMPTMIIK